MSRLIIILFLLTSSKFYSQKIEKEVGDFKIIKEGFYFNETDKKKKISKSAFYFDTFGKIIEKVSYGKPHYRKLNVKGEIEQFFYSENRLDSSKKYVLECFTCDYYLYYSKFNYNENGKLLSENRFRGENDSLLTASNYIYKPNYSETHFNSTTYYQRKYNSENKIIEFNQVFEKTNKLRWQYLFEYTNDCKIGKFQTYYGDGKENSKIETECFDSENRIISKEIVALYKTKVTYSYSENGILNETKEYESFFDKDNYKLKRLIKIKVNRKTKSQSKEIIENINSALISQ
jgi:hypothetical protein